MATLIIATYDYSHLPILLVIGFAILAGTIGARIFQRLRIPQVVGYITIGVLVGKSGLGVINDAMIDKFMPFSFFALGVIGFLIGRELRAKALREQGRQFLIILLSQGIGAFVVVALLVSGVAFLLTGDLALSAALGLVLGAISSATAPAATVNVLWEYKTRGPLTRAVYAIVALDDGLALVLFALAFSIASRLIGTASGGILGMLGQVTYELAGAAVLGAGAAFLLTFVLRRVQDQGRSMTFTIGMLAIVLGGAMALKLNLILASMVLGTVLVNLAPRRSQEAFQVVERFAEPIYVLFFVVVGAQLGFGGMDYRLWLLALPYCLGRIFAKVGGAYLGARLAGASVVMRRYLGMCLFCQGGVAVGLGLIASAGFASADPRAGLQIGSAIMLIIAVTTFVVELVGPPFVKLALKKAGEVGLNVTEEDLIASYRTADVMDRSSPSFKEGTTLVEILATIAESDANAFPITNADGQLTGVITIHEFKQSFRFQEMGNWLVAADLMQPVPDTVAEDTSLADAIALMRSQQLEFLPVVRADDKTRLAGMLVLRAVHRALSAEILRRHELAASNGG
jgi:Kef-type K+ transport system membrane component KefB/predicted transcriptional regulator